MLLGVDRSKLHGTVFGVFCLLAAAGLAAQSYITYQKGYVYCGRTEVVHRKDHARKFAFFVGVQIFFVITLIALSIFGFLT